MARWDKFLNEASRGYGVGFNRYQQYADARDKRLNRADMAEVAAGMQQLENAQAIPTQVHETRFEDAPVQAMPVTPTATGGGAQTAVNTAPPPPVMLDRDPTRRDMVDSGMGYADSALTPYQPPMERDPVRGGMALAGVSPERQQEILDRGRQAEIAAGGGEFGGGAPMRPDTGKAPAKPKAVEEAPKKGEGETAAASALEAVTMMAGPNKGKVPYRIDTTKYSTDTPTAEVWNNVRAKLMDVAIRNGDYESVIAMPEKIAGMQQQGFLRHMEQAMQVQDDPEALAALLTKAYSYYPDGSAMQFQVQDGQLYGYGFDEATGKFQGGAAITPETMAMAMERAQDPVEFYKTKRASELAAQERREDMAFKDKEYKLELFKANSTAALNTAKQFHSAAQGNEIYAELMNLDGESVMAWENGAADVQDNQTQAVESLDKMYQSKKWPDPRLEMLVGEDGLGYRKVSKIVSSIAGNATPDQNLGMEVVPMYAAAVGELELVNSRIESGDADQDELLEVFKSNQIDNVFLTPAGNINMTVDGMPLEVSSGLVPGIANRVMEGGAQQPAPTAVDPSAPVEGQPLNTRQALGVIGDKAMDALGTGAEYVGKAVANAPPIRAAGAVTDAYKAGIKGLGEALREPPGKPQGRGSKSKAAPAVKPQKLESVIDALIMAESGGDPMAVSPVGAQGLAQVMPATARDPGFGVTPLKDPFDPVQSRRFAKEYLGAMLDRYDDNLEAALVAYNAGPGNGDKFVRAGNDFSVLPKRSETEPYVRKITGALSGG